jgi:TonB family protein
MQISFSVRLIALSALAVAATASAAEQAPPPPPPVTCAGPVAANFVPAKVIENPSPAYPGVLLKDTDEGWVKLEYTVSDKGAVKDVAAVDWMGPFDFVEEAKRTVAKWKFAPATRNGKPVEESRHVTEIVYRINSGQMSSEGSSLIVVYGKAGVAKDIDSTHEGFWNDIEKAVGQLNNEKYADASSTLEYTLQKPTNMPERAHASLSLASARAMLGNGGGAYQAIKHATVRGGENLQKKQREDALSFRMRLAIQHGDYADAVCAFDGLKAMDSDEAESDGPAGKMMASLNAVLTNPAPLKIPAKLAASRTGAGVWEHRMLRPNFSFAQVQGQVTKFRLACTGTLLELPVDTEQQWTIPPTAGACVLRVQGSPGASFVFVEES